MICSPRSRRSSSPIFRLILGLRGAGSSFYVNVCGSCSGVERWVEKCGVLDFGILQFAEICCLLVFFFFLHFVWRCGCCHYIFECWSFLSFASFVFYCCFLAWWILLSASWMFCSLLFFYFALWLCGFCYRIFENVDAFCVLFSFCFFYLHFGFPWILASEFEPKLLEFSFLLCLTCIFALLALIFYNFD